MVKALSLKQTKQEDTSTLVLEGPMDQHADYSAATLVGFSQIVIDFKDITLVNSAGIQKWVLFLRETPAETKVIFDKCPVKIVHQMNLFPGFTAGKDVTVKSFYAPYFCNKQNQLYNILLETDVFFKNGDGLEAPPMFCPSCKEALEFDGIEKKYFLFIKRLRSARAA